MSEQLTAWIGRVAALNDLDLEERAQIGQQEFTQCIRKSRPELDSHTYRNVTY